MSDANPKQAFGDKKIPLHLVPPAAAAYIAVGMREGATKYGAWNYRDTHIEMMTYLGAMKRHLDALLEGEWIDDDDMFMPDGTPILDLPKKPHLAGLMASAAILADQYEMGTVIDNRPKPNKGYGQFMKDNQRISEK